MLAYRTFCLALFLTDWDNFSDFFLSFLKVSMNNNKKVNFWSQPASVDFTCLKVFIFNAKLGFLVCRVCADSLVETAF